MWKKTPWRHKQKHLLSSSAANGCEREPPMLPKMMMMSFGRQKGEKRVPLMMASLADADVLGAVPSKSAHKTSASERATAKK